MFNKYVLMIAQRVIINTYLAQKFNQIGLLV